MLYAKICPNVRRHNARPYFPSGRALCLLTLGHILAYNMDNTILLHKYYFNINTVELGWTERTGKMCYELLIV